MSKIKMVRRVLLPLALVIGVFSVNAAGAQAWTLHEVKYGPAPLPAHSAVEAPCCSWTRTDVTGNIVIYEGAGTVSVCQLTYDIDTGQQHNGCGNNAVGNALNLTPYYGHHLAVSMMNNSEWTHTIRGVWYYGNP
jgi:hypothetical protein